MSLVLYPYTFSVVELDYFSLLGVLGLIIFFGVNCIEFEYFDFDNTPHFKGFMHSHAERGNAQVHQAIRDAFYMRINLFVIIKHTAQHTNPRTKPIANYIHLTSR